MSGDSREQFWARRWIFAVSRCFECAHIHCRMRDVAQIIPKHPKSAALVNVMYALIHPKTRLGLPTVQLLYLNSMHSRCCVYSVCSD